MFINLNPKVNDKFKKWVNRNQGNHGKVKANRGKVHEYLGMTFDFTEKGQVKLIWATMLKR